MSFGLVRPIEGDARGAAAGYGLGQGLAEGVLAVWGDEDVQRWATLTRNYGP